MGNLIGGRMAIEGRLARFVYKSLYRMHLIAVHGWLTGLTLLLVGRVNTIVRPRLKLHWSKGLRSQNQNSVWVGHDQHRIARASATGSAPPPSPARSPGWSARDGDQQGTPARAAFSTSS